jgi:hypothetical protein
LPLIFQSQFIIPLTTSNSKYNFKMFANRFPTIVSNCLKLELIFVTPTPPRLEEVEGGWNWRGWRGVCRGYGTNLWKRVKTKSDAIQIPALDRGKLIV